MSELLTTREFADAIGVVPETVRRWVRGGKLTPAGETLGGHKRFLESQVAEVLGSRGLTKRAQLLCDHVNASLARFEARRGKVS